MMGNRCKICGHKKLSAINADLVAKWRTRDGFRHIAKRYAVTLPGLYRHFCNDLPETLWRSEAARKELRADTLLSHMQRHYDRLEKLLGACEEVLQDPDNPGRWVVGSSPRVIAQARAEDLTVFFQRLEGDKVVNCRAKLDLLLEKIEAAGAAPVMVTRWEYRGEPVQRTARETARALREYLELVGKLTGQLPQFDLEVVISAVTDALRPHPRSLAQLLQKLREADIQFTGRN